MILTIKILFYLFGVLYIMYTFLSKNHYNTAKNKFMYILLALTVFVFANLAVLLVIYYPWMVFALFFIDISFKGEEKDA